MTDCPVCACKNINAAGEAGGGARFDCPRCGEFRLTGSAVAVLPEQLSKGVQRAAIMSHAIRRMGSGSVLGSRELDSFWDDERLPPASKQAGDLILWAADNQLSPDTYQRCASYFLGAWIGTALAPVGTDRHHGLFWVLMYLANEGLLESRHEADGDPTAFNPIWGLRLTMRGWERYSQLKKTRSDSRAAFMAMKFGDSVLDTLVETHFKPAVLRAGFELRKLTDNQPAGSIDDQIRASIISGRFVIADLTHGNRGAYWEAGFAEGLGLPVIYTCEKTVWDSEKTHFDTNHLVTIIWDAANPKAAAEGLTATIRATFRADAKQDG